MPTSPSSPPRVRLGTLRLLAVSLLAACAPGGDSPGKPSTPTPLATAPLAPLDGPASWTGEVPCADCAGIRTTLTLDPDGSYRRLDAYLGKGPGPDTLFAGVGRWILEEERSRLVLRGSGASHGLFAVQEDGALRMLDQEGTPIESELNHTLVRLPSPGTMAGPLELLGGFTYLADAALLVECESGLQFRVAMEGAYLPLERAYMAAAIEPGSPLLVRVRGRLASRPAMEGEGMEEMFLVESHGVQGAGIGCGALQLREALASGEWRLILLDGSPIPGSPGETPTLGWDPLESRVAGNSGCNRYTGRGFLRGTLLVVQQVAVTRRFCQGAMELEARVLELIGEGGVLHLDGGELVLSQGPLEVARFSPGPG